jgi:hypothetical protein
MLKESFIFSIPIILLLLLPLSKPKKVENLLQLEKLKQVHYLFLVGRFVVLLVVVL